MSNPLIEFYEENHLIAYKCPAGVWTISRGITRYPDGAKVKEGDTCTQEESEAYLNHHLNNEIQFPIDNLTLNQRTALESLIFNIGQGAFNRSKLKKAILEKDYKNIYKNWDWISITVKNKKTGRGVKKALRGLCARRAEELNLFMKDPL